MTKKIICPKVTEMGSIIGHRIDYNEVGVLRGQYSGSSGFSRPDAPGEKEKEFLSLRSVTSGLEKPMLAR